MRSFKRLGFGTRQGDEGQARDGETAFGASPRDRGEPVEAGDGDRVTADGERRVLAAVYDTSGRELTLEPEPEVNHPLDAARRPRNDRRWLVTKDLTTPADPRRDREAADRIVTLVRELNEAMEAASRNGLLVEPSLTRVKGRYGNLDEDGGQILSIKLFRKLC